MQTNFVARIISIILAAVTLLLLATFPGYEEEYEGGPERKRLPSRAVSQIALAVIFVAAIFVLVSVLWQHTASVAAATIAENLENGSVSTGVGVTAMVLGWFGFALLIIVTIGLLVMFVPAPENSSAMRVKSNIISGFCRCTLLKNSATETTYRHSLFPNLTLKSIGPG
jgi:hypothetical protein